MAKERPQAPKASVKIAYVDPKLQIEQEYDRKHPEYKHFWLSNESKMEGVEFVKDPSGERVTNKIQSLARIPMDVWKARKKTQADATLDLMKTIRSNEDGTAFSSDPLVQYANPKKVQTEE